MKLRNDLDIILILLFICHQSFADNTEKYKEQELSESIKKLQQILQTLKSRTNENSPSASAGGEKLSQTAGRGAAGGCTEKCPTFECKKSFQMNNELMANNSKIAQLGTFKSVCGGNYFFSNLVMDYLKASTFCCSIGLRLAVIESGPKLFCLTRIHKENFPTEKAYWTSASFNSCSRKFWWCRDQMHVLTRPDFMKAAPVEHMKPTSCLFVTLKNKDHIRSGMTVNSCTAKMPVLCQSDEIVTTTTQNPTCNKPECPLTAATCPKFKNLTSYEGFKHIGTGCGKHLFYSSFDKDLPAASKTCCDMGMRLLSVETMAQKSCLIKLTSKEKMEKEILASACNIGCDKAWRWCGSDKPLENNFPWDAGEPSKYHDVYNCAYFRTDTGRRFMMSSMPCYYYKRFICEVNS